MKIPAGGTNNDDIFPGHKSSLFNYLFLIENHFKMNQQMYNLHTEIPRV
jgi:hypothetical protein